MSVAGLCLAAGGSSRLGRPKQLLPWGEATLLQTSVRGLLRAPLSCLTVVLGADAPAAAASLEPFSADERFSAVVNERWADGMSCFSSAETEERLQCCAATAIICI